MDGSDNFQCKGWMRRHDSQQRRIGGSDTLPAQCCNEHTPILVCCVDRNADVFTRDCNSKRVLQIHVHERRNMEDLLTLLSDYRTRVWLDSNQISMAFAKGVVHFVQECREGPVSSIAKVDAEWIKDLTEKAWHAQEADVAVIGLDTRRPEMMIDLIAQRHTAAIAVINVVKAHRIQPIVRK